MLKIELKLEIVDVFSFKVRQNDSIDFYRLGISWRPYIDKVQTNREKNGENPYRESVNPSGKLGCSAQFFPNIYDLQARYV